MTLPNLLIIGAQKCGTTWLHQALRTSEYFWGSRPKELNFWNKRETDLAEYEAYFEAAPETAKYIYESTPHYFRLPKNGHDIAKNIRQALGDIPLILMLRDPVERYLSAYTHHAMKDRVPMVDAIEGVSNGIETRIRDLGRYSEILTHFRGHFSTINIYLYDDLKSGPFELIENVFAALDVPCEITPSDIDFRVNTKRKKQRRLDIEKLPTLSDDFRKELNDYYRDDVRQLETMINRDLSGWLG